ncbi:MAG TPA: hypothetical protein VGC63_01230 [Solirubrobacterales bacterium]
MTRLVTVQLSEFACSAVGGEAASGGEQLSARIVAAIRCYLNDKGSGGLRWAYPNFLADEEQAGGEVTLRLAIDDRLWSSLEQEAECQGVTPKKMVTHAALYVAAEVDAGRVTRRILDDLAQTG